MQIKIGFQGFLLFSLILCAVFVEPALAGPGGKIAQAVFETFWGKILLFGLVIFFLPLICYTLIQEKLASRRALKDLRFMSRYSPQFDWLKIRERILDCFHRVHSAWSKEDMAAASEYMSDWYWQNQQLVYLDKWESDGLVNHCEVKKIKSLQPILFSHRNDGKPHEGSLLVAMIDANMKDYLARREDGKVVEGSKKWKDVETLWSFTMIDGKWQVSNIEDGSLSLEYVDVAKTLPAIEETLPDRSTA